MLEANVTQPSSGSPNLLNLSSHLNLDPDILIGNGNGIFAAGAQGTGKSVILKRILEEIAMKANCPLVAFDKEDDLKAVVKYFPRGIIGTFKNCPSARDIYNEGLQVVYDLSTWPNMDMAGEFIARLVCNLMMEADMTPFHQRVPLIVVLDEASYWLPHNRKASALDDEVLASLHNAFESLASRGRKRGLVPALFTQKFSHIAKEVLSPGTYILCGQNLHTERKRYLDYVLPVGEFKYYTERQTMQRIGDLVAGEAIVKLSDNTQVVTQFYECRSEHVARTPKAQAAQQRYEHASFEPTKRYGAYIEDEKMDLHSTPPEPPIVQHGSKTAQIRKLLEQDHNIKSSEIARIVGCNPSTVSKVRTDFFAGK